MGADDNNRDGVVGLTPKKPLEKEIEELRNELDKCSRYLDNDKLLDPEFYALSKKMDKLIVRYMKNKKT